MARNVSARMMFVFWVVLASAGDAHCHQAPAAPLGPAQRRAVRLAVQDFRLIDQNGRRFEFSAVKGKIVVLAFAYTSCPDVCPLITAAMKQVQSDLNQAENAAVYFLTVTTDPEVDSAKVLAAYAARFGADLSNWAFLTGEADTLKKVWQNFGVRVIKKKRGLIDHTSLTAVIDRGTMRVGYSGTAPDSKDILRDVRALLVHR